MIPEQLEDLRSGQFCGWLGGVIPIARSFCKPRFFPQNQHDFVLPGDVSAKGAEDLRSPVPKRRRSNWAVMLIRCQSSGNPSLCFRDEGEDSRKI